MKKRILFVDDEEMVLQGLRRMLRPYRDEWDMVFVDSGPKALEIMAQEPFDVVVADMRMPVMNGAELLHEVMKRHPLTVRLILSGHSDNELILKAMGATHQYLAKPCDQEVLRTVLRRAIASVDVLQSPELKILIGKMTSLPSLPALYQEIIGKLRDPNIQLEDITGVIARDLGMTAKILQLVNSSFFGLPHHVTDLNAAVSFLGLNVITSLFLSFHIFTELEGVKIPGFSIDNLWKHSLDTAYLASKISKLETRSDVMGNESFVAGILHDSGRIVLASNFPDQYREAMNVSMQDQCDLSESERKTFGHTHSEVGGYLMSLWGLPVPIVDAVAYHHNPGILARKEFCTLTAVHAANSLVGSNFENGHEIATNSLDMDYLASLNMAERLSHWQQLVRKGGFDHMSPPADDK